MFEAARTLGTAAQQPRREAANRAASRRTEQRMALADIEAELTGEIPWRTCAVCHRMSERGDEWAARLRRMLSNRGLKFKTLAAKLKADPDEPDIDWQALSRHARGECAARDILRPQEPRR